MSDRVTIGYLLKLMLSFGSWATSVPHLRLQLKPDQIDLGIRIGSLAGGQELQIGEVSRQRETTRELRDVVAVASKALDPDDPIRLLESRQPEAFRIPAGVVDGRRVVSSKLREDVRI